MFSTHDPFGGGVDGPTSTRTFGMTCDSGYEKICKSKQNPNNTKCWTQHGRNVAHIYIYIYYINIIYIYLLYIYIYINISI